MIGMTRYFMTVSLLFSLTHAATLTNENGMDKKLLMRSFVQFDPAPATPIAVLDAPAQRRSDILAVVVIAVLSLSASAVLYVQRDYLQNMSKTEIAATISLLGYMGLTITVDVLIRKFHQSGSFDFHPAVMTFLIEVGKVAACGVFAGIDWQRTRETRCADFAKTMKVMVIPAMFYVVLNLGRYKALSGADLDEYRVWRCTDILFVAIMWFGMFRKLPRPQQVGGIALVFVACAVMKVQDGIGHSFQLAWPVMTIIGLAFVSSFGLVTNELGLKASADLSIFVQNIALYTVTSVLNFAYVLGTVPMAETFKGIGWPQLLLLVLDVALGMCVACVIKHANSIIKQLASGWLAPLEPLIGHFVVGTPVTPLNVLSAILAGAGTIVYRLEPPANKAEAEAILRAKAIK